MIIDECQEKMNCLYSLVNVSSVISDLSIFITGWGGGGKEFWREHLVFRGNGGVSGILIQVYPTPPRAINNGRSFMITRAFVTVCHST